MATLAAPCAVTLPAARGFAPASCNSSQRARAGASTVGFLPVPHIVHVRFDDFLVSRDPGQPARFRRRMTPIDLDTVRPILELFTPAVDSDSSVGFYLNFYGSRLLSGDFAATLRRLQLEILRQLGLEVSVGAARSKVAAVVASRVENPGGVRILTPGAEASFLAKLPIAALHSINSIDAVSLGAHGITSIGELCRVPRAVLVLAYGDVLAANLWRNSRALDTTAVSASPASLPRKSWLRAAAEALYDAF